MNTPFISIIIPMYNQEKYITQCIDSILTQNFKDYEIIIIDDCSSDNSIKIVNDRYHHHENITLIKQHVNGGQGYAKNKGLNIAKGKYITFIDSDDFIAENFLNTLFEFAEKSQFEIINMGYTEHKLVENEWKDARSINVVNKITSIPNVKDRISFMCAKRLLCTTWGKLYRHDFLKKYNLLYEKIPNDDVLFHFKSIYYTQNYLLLPHTLYYVRETPNSVTRNYYPEKPKIMLEQAIKVFVFLNNYLSKMDNINNDKEICKSIYKFFFEIYFNHCYIRSIDKQTISNVNNKNFEVLNSAFNENYLFVKFLLESYLKSKFNISL